jgi:hypothetical protein
MKRPQNIGEEYQNLNNFQILRSSENFIILKKFYYNKISDKGIDNLDSFEDKIKEMVSFF